MTTRYNIKPDIVEALQTVTSFKLISPDYPSDWSKLPASIYTTSSKPNRLDLSKGEVLTEWTIKIDLYHTKSLTDIQEQVIKAFKHLGFKNTAINDANTDVFKRTILTFRGIVDNRTLIVYQ